MNVSLGFSVWTMRTKKLHLDLPGHGDEVYAVDWSPDSQRVVSGGRDKILKLKVLFFFLFIL